MGNLSARAAEREGPKARDRCFPHSRDAPAHRRAPRRTALTATCHPVASAMCVFQLPHAAFSRLVMFSTVLLACFGLGGARRYGTALAMQHKQPHRRQSRAEDRCTRRCPQHVPRPPPCSVAQRVVEPPNKSLWSGCNRCARHKRLNHRSTPSARRTTRIARLAATTDTHAASCATRRPWTASAERHASKAANAACRVARCTEHPTKPFKGSARLSLRRRSPHAIRPNLPSQPSTCSVIGRPCPLRPSPPPTFHPIRSSM